MKRLYNTSHMENIFSLYSSLSFVLVFRVLRHNSEFSWDMDSLAYGITAYDTGLFRSTHTSII